MRQIVPPVRIVQKILGTQKSNEEIPCRLSVHCIQAALPEGILLYHTLTGELLLLSCEEARQLAGLPGPVPPALEELISRWFLRPEGADDMALADQARQIAGHFGKNDGFLKDYLLFPTTDCNARCFYCFEAGWQKRSMTERTARETARYIASHRGGKPVHLEWSGGEPLVNVRAIDVMTDSLRAQAVAFWSSMITNGYLFDEPLIRRARDAWNLELTQITLDGTEDVYNARKAYVHPAGSAFQRVLQNIGLLLEAGVRVNVRLNMDRDNENDLYVLVDQLAARFRGRPGFGVYFAALRENEGSAPLRYTEDERRARAQKCRALQAYAKEKGIAVRVSLDRGLAVNACVADSGTFTTVTPDGHLGRCGACVDGIWGSVYSHETDEEVLRQWKERMPPDETCRICPVYPQCIRLKKCPHKLEHCSPIERASREDKIYRAVMGAYEDWAAAGGV